MNTALSISIQGYQLIRERIKALETDLDETTLHDTIEGLSDLHTIIEHVVRSALADEALATALRLRVRDMQERLSRIERRAGNRRGIARDAMLEAGIPTLQRPEFTLSLSPGRPGVSVVDEKQIPNEFWEPREPTLNKVGLLAELKRGIVVPGASLTSPSPVLTVRVR